MHLRSDRRRERTRGARAGTYRETAARFAAKSHGRGAGLARSGSGRHAGPVNDDPHVPAGDGVELEAAGWVPPDPHEPPPVELWRAVGDVRPWGTLLMLLAWGIAYLLLGAHGALGDADALAGWGANVTGLPAGEAAWRLLASTFLHSGFVHLFFNATSMLVLGPTMERLFMRRGFAVVYALGGVAASAASLAWRAWPPSGGAGVSVGASGAIFALGGATIVGALRLRRRLAPTRARAMAAALLYLVAPGLASGFSHPGTDNVAHAAGVLAGILFGLALPLHPRLGGEPAPVAESVLAVLATLALAASFAIGIAHGFALR